MTKQVITIGTAVMTTLLGLVVLWQFRTVAVYLMISLALAATVRPLVKRLPQKPLILRLAWILLYILVLVGVGIAIFFIGGQISSEVQQFVHSMSAQNEWNLPLWLQGSSFQQLLVTQLPTPSDLFEAVTGAQGQLVFPALLGFTLSMVDVISGGLFILFLSIYWIVNQVHFERLWLSILPSEKRKQARDVWRTIEPDLGAYIRSQLIHSLLAGLLLGLGYWVLGSPYPLVLALTGALACLIPLVGPVLALIAPLLVGLMTGLQLSIFTVLFTLVILIALGIWVKPRLFNRRWDNPILTLILLILLAKTLGLFGIIIAPPLSAVCQILWSLLVSHRLASGAAENISDLRHRQDQVWDNIRAMGEPPMPLLSSSMERLTHLIEKAEPILVTALTEEIGESILPTAVPPEQNERLVPDNKE